MYVGGGLPRRARMPGRRAVTAAAVLAPALGEHVLAYDALTTGSSPKTTAAITTQASGSTILVGVAWGELATNINTPTDSKGNAYTQIGTSHTYTNWTDSGTTLYRCLNATGGASHTFSVTKTGYTTDEVTLTVVEVKNGGVVQDAQWAEVLEPGALTSPNVTTTGPAVLVAWWYGDDGTGPHTASANNSFTVIESLLNVGSVIQCAVAVREVADAGTYNVTWTETPDQGAQMWIVAIQKA